MLAALYVIFCGLALAQGTFRCDNGPEKRAALGSIKLWPDKIVPYEIDNVYSSDDKRLIRESLEEFMSLTSNCIRFVDRTASHPVWVHVVSRAGCSSAVGLSKASGAQELSLDRSGCMTKSTVMHEFLHALGFHHEQTRPDRDKYVKVLEENVEPGKNHNFKKNPSAELQSVGMPYDFGSVMHYVHDGFSTNGLPTMVTVAVPSKEWRYSMGNATTLSSTDVYKIKKIYNCPV